LFPLLAPLMGEPVTPKTQQIQFIESALADTDQRVAEGRSVAPSFMLACLMWHDVRERWQAAQGKGAHAVPALQESIDAVFDARIGDISGRGKLGADMREIWLMQPRFERRAGSSPYSLIDQPRYRAAYDFLRLRADCGEIDAELADWWEDFALGTNEEREALIEAAREAQRAQPRRVPAAPRPQMEAAPSPEDGAAPAKKRRRRRRKPAAAGSSEAPPTAPEGT
jgi:poly(A) polymerase